MPAPEVYDSALVLGLGRSGAAAARLLLGEGTKVTVVDEGDGPSLQERAGELRSMGATVSLGTRTITPAVGLSVCVVSPGVPAESEWIAVAVEAGAAIVAEIELGWTRSSSRTLAITGSNGKSTVAKLCRDALVRAGASAGLAGNYGLPMCEAVASDTQTEWIVLEVSSFQLETVREFRPEVGVLLNLLPNHLDRHGDMASYQRVKSKLFARMTDRGIGVVPSDLASVIATELKGEHKWVTFGTSADSDCIWQDGDVTCGGRALPCSRGDGAEMSSGMTSGVSFRDTYFDNPVLGLAAAATVAAICGCGYSPENAGLAAQTFEPLAHRMQTVCDRGGVRFIDDSKATNLAALSAALEMCDRPARLIAGGRLKEHDLALPKECLAKDATCVYLIGEAAEAMAAAWSAVTECRICGNLQAAVDAAWKDSLRGEAVLLAPGCTSFDQFNNFEERGDRFKEIVESLSCDPLGRGGVTPRCFVHKT